MTEHVLGIGILAALIAAGVQGAIGGRALRSLRNGAASESDARSKVALAQRIAALLLAVTVICMVAARYA
jgi:DMSO reductase anchor subunit